VYNVIDINTFDILQEDVNCFFQEGDVMVCGDVNARIGIKKDFVEFDQAVVDIDDVSAYSADIPLVRVSQDHKTNKFGNNLLDLCRSTGLRVVNGRLGHDEGIGKCTYYCELGSSVIDYVLARQDTFDMIDNFMVDEFKVYSDHAPLSFRIKTCTVADRAGRNGQGMVNTVKWDDVHRQQFRDALYIRRDDFGKLFADVNECEDVTSLTQGFTDLLNDVAKPFFEKQFLVKGPHGFDRMSTSNDQSRWFDGECRESKRLYKNALHTFSVDNTNGSRHALCEKKKSYKACIRKKKYLFKLQQKKELEDMRRKKPKDFWKFFSKRKKTVGSDLVSSEDFFTYFTKLESEINTVSDENVNTFVQNEDFDGEDCVFDELDCAITIEEVLAAVKKLKHSKAPGIDGLLNEYFIEGIDVLGPYLCQLFNSIFDSGVFPEEWTKGILIPLHKKGSKSDASNYRGITLVSCLTKLFSTVMNDRLVLWCEKANIISDAQFGFRKGCSTVDAIFILQNIVQHFLHNGKKLYCAFVDLKKAFDSVYRNGLWYKLHGKGVRSKMLHILKAMYDSVKVTIRHCNNYSDFFDSYVGLKQGEVLSPLLFSLFIEDLEMFLADPNSSGLSLMDINLFLLLFADDMIVLAETADDLQQSLNRLHVYCMSWGLEVNVEKTKIVVFRRRGRVEQHWTYDNQVVDVVDSFNYLGVVANYNGSFANHCQLTTGKGLKAMNALLCNTREIMLSPRILCQLFDSFVGSVLSYGSEVWGFTKCQAIERVHLKFCKRILRVKQCASTAGVYGELGRYPLYITRYMRILKYWFKVTNSENCILRTIYNVAKSDLLNKGCKNWVYNVKDMLCSNGFGYVWDNPGSVKSKEFLLEFKTRMIDCFKQKWLSDIHSSPSLDFYTHIKSALEYEPYLDSVSSVSQRSLVTKLRISAHNLNIEIKRYGPNRLQRHDRLCELCESGDIEDEYHFVCCCTAFGEERKILPKYVYIRPSMFKFVEYMTNLNDIQAKKLAKFVLCADKQRKNCILARR
jgi:hypothetical protein